jgi:hypothetical protein
MLTDLDKRFVDPPRSCSPTPIWWWSGEALDPPRLRWQLERFAEGHVYNLVVLNLAPTGPLYGSDPDRPRFLSEEWWAFFRGVCRDAAELGIRLWFYDQVGFSGANFQAEIVKAHSAFSGKALQCVTSVVTGSGTLDCPAGGDPIAAAVIPIDDRGAASGEPVMAPLSGRQVTWSGADRHRLMLFYSVDRGFDYLNPDACQALFDTIHESFAARAGDFFGTVIVGSFQDELPAMPTWSANFAAAFAKRHGYDLIPQLAALWEDYGDHAARVRVDYQTTRAELAERAFFQPLFAWHEQRGLICGFDQQDPARAGYPIASVDLYADYQRTHRWFGAPGSDHHGEAKIHSSLAHLYGRPRTWIEAFHSSGWGGTLEETFDWLLPWLRAGANLYNPHAVYYSTRGGQWEWAPPATDWRQPYWQHYALFADTVSRLCSVLTAGRHVCDVAVLFPATTVQAGLRLDGANAEARAAQATYLQLVGQMRWFEIEPGILDRQCVDFDVLDEDSIQRGQALDGRLFIADEAYATIILPSCAALQTATATRLVEFVEQGGTLIAVGALPRLAVGAPGAGDAVPALATLVQQQRITHIANVADLAPILANLPRRITAPVPTLMRQIGDATVVFIPAISPRATAMPHRPSRGAELGWLDIDYQFDPSRYTRSMKINVRGLEGNPVLWEPFSGNRRPLACARNETGLEIEVPFIDAPGALLVWEGSEANQASEEMPPASQEAHMTPGVSAGNEDADPAGPSGPARSSGPSGPSESQGPGSEQALDGPWQVTVEPTLDNRWGDFALPASLPPFPVECWAMRHTIAAPGQDNAPGAWADPDLDDAHGPLAHATFGPHGLWTGPAEPRALPQPARSVSAWQASLAARGSGLPPAINDPDGKEWREAVYSLARGIYKDRLHRGTLGPKGHVPEEFLDFGRIPAGQAIRFRTALTCSAPLQAHLALGAPARKRVWLDGDEVAVTEAGYLAMIPATLHEGEHLLEFQLEAEEEVDLRAHFAFIQDVERYRRPEWMRTAGRPAKDSLVSYAKRFHLPAPPVAARVQVGAVDPCRVRVNGREVGRQGGFDPYFERHSVRIQSYDLMPYLAPGENEIRLDLTDLGIGAAVLVDALIQTATEPVAIMSDATWQAERNGRPAPLNLQRQQWGDPAWALLYRRPHPLPDSAWLEGPQPAEVVVPLVPHIPPVGRRAEWFRFLLPPGAHRMRLALHGAVTVYVNGQETSIDRQDGGLVSVHLPQVDAPRRVCALRVAPEPGFTSGAVFAGPIQFDVGPGVMTLGNWEDLGLAGYSGAVRYARQFQWAASAHGPVLLDLGKVRGTAEVFLNGRHAGVRIWSPYRFDLSAHIRPGENTLEIRILNTLGPYLDAASPTHFVFPGQTVSGLFGPVRLVAVG